MCEKAWECSTQISVKRDNLSMCQSSLEFWFILSDLSDLNIYDLSNPKDENPAKTCMQTISLNLQNATIHIKFFFSVDWFKLMS